MNSYASFVSYFRDLVAAHAQLQQFVVGGFERILNRNQSIIQYPIFWLEVPDIGMKRGGSAGSYSSTFQGAFVVLANAQNDDWEREEADLDLCLTICYQILARMQSDADAGEWSFTLDNINIEHKGKFSNDNDWGWRVSFNISMPIDDCIDDEAFDDD